MDHSRLVDAVVDFSAVVRETFLDQHILFSDREIMERAELFLSKLCSREFLLFELIPDHIVLASFGGEVLASPRPVHSPLTRALWTLIKVTRSTDAFIDNSVGLKTVSENDVWVHSRDIQVVNERTLDAIGDVSHIL